jgi:quercetin dioxygenase-like cupin family protein
MRSHVVAASVVAASILIAAAGAPAVAQQPQTLPHFSCLTLGHRQVVPGNPNLAFRVLKLTFEPGYDPSQNMHRHKYGEIVYLLSGQGADQTIAGKKTPLSPVKALFIPPTEVHTIVPTGKSLLSVISVQFTDATAPAFTAVSKVPAVCKD